MKHCKAKPPSLLTIMAVVFIAGSAVADGTINPTNTTEPKKSIILPSTYDSGLFFLSVMIGDTGPYTMVLDTGASFCVVSPETVEQLQTTSLIRPSGILTLKTASGDDDQFERVSIRGLRLGEFRAHLADAAVADMSLVSMLFDSRVDGFIGMQVFEFESLALDYPGRQVRLEPAPARAPGSLVLECDFRTFLPHVQVEVAGDNHTMLVDSGSSSGFFLPLEVANRLPFAIEPVTTGLSVGGSGTLRRMEGRLDSDLNWGGVLFKRPIVQLSQFPLDSGMIGTEVLTNFVVRVDQWRQELVLSDPVQKTVVFNSLRSTGLSLLPGEDFLKVEFVVPNTDAERAGIREGDLIVAINGEPASQWSWPRFSKLSDGTEPFEVEVVRGEETQTFQLGIAVLVE